MPTDPYNNNFGIGGSTNFGGGLIYSLDWKISEDQSPSKASIYAIGTNAPPPDLTTLSSIMAGTYQMGMYLVKSETRNKGGGQKITVGEFVDGSIVLDRFYIGLVGSFSELNKNRAYTGTLQYLSPDALTFRSIGCTGITYDDGKANVNHGNLIILGSETVDPLSPCGNRRIEYSLNELLSAITSKVPLNIGNLIPNPRYRQSYVGTLRQVLGQWFSDYGYAFYWDGAQVNTLDLRSGINIDLPSFDFPDTCSQGSTLENTYGQAVAVSFRKPQEEKSVQSVNHRTIYFNCIHLDNVVEESVAQELEKQAVLAYYSQYLRDYYLFREGGDTNTSDKYAALGMTNVQTFNQDSAAFTAFQSSMTTALATSQGNPEVLKVVTALAGLGGTRRLIVCDYNDAARNGSYQLSRSIAESFIGKYYTTQQSLSPLVIEQYYTSKGELRLGSASYKYIQSNSSVAEMPFGNILSSAALATAEGVIPGELPSNPAAGSYLLIREGVWSPGATNGIDAVIGQAVNKCVCEISSDMVKDVPALKALVTTLSQRIFLFVENTDIQISDLQYVNNYAETDTVQNNLNAQGAINNQIVGSTPCEICIQANENRDPNSPNNQNNRLGFGLRGVGNAPSVDVRFPGGNYTLIGPSQFDYQGTEVITTSKKFIIPEINKVYVTGDEVPGVYGFDVVQKDATVDYILNIGSALPHGGMVPIGDVQPVYKDQIFTNIDVYLKQIALTIYAPQVQPQFYAEFREMGYPSRPYTPASGLAGISVEVGEGGVYTTYKFSSRPYKKPTTDLVFAGVNVSSNTSFIKRLT